MGPVLVQLLCALVINKYTYYVIIHNLCLLFREALPLVLNPLHEAQHCAVMRNVEQY